MAMEGSTIRMQRSNWPVSHARAFANAGSTDPKHVVLNERPPKRRDEGVSLQCLKPHLGALDDHGLGLTRHVVAAMGHSLD